MSNEVAESAHSTPPPPPPAARRGRAGLILRGLTGEEGRRGL